MPAPYFTKLKRIPNPKGDILHAFKSSDAGFAGFGEVYFTHINFGETKGWKRHNEMLMNLIVPAGDVAFFCVDSANQVKKFTLGENRYGRLTVPPGIWLAFRGISQKTNLIMNIASIEHNPDEADTRPIDFFDISAL